MTIEAAPNKAKISVNDTPAVSFTEAQILEKSQIRYIADGGFTDLKSYSIVISCVKGRISVLKTLHPLDPQAQPKRRASHLERDQYLTLWTHLTRQNVFRSSDIADPNRDIDAEFTVQFEVSAGDHTNQFRVFAINRPEAARHYAIKNLIDSSVQMSAFLSDYPQVAKK